MLKYYHYLIMQTKMFNIMIEISKHSLKALGSEVFNQITNNK